MFPHRPPLSEDPAAFDVTPDDHLLVACLCADWCTSCRAYRAVFDEAAAAHPDIRFIWVDVEDSADLLERVDVENFPTILIGDERGPRFFGTITPQRDVLLRLVAAHHSVAGAPVAGSAEIAGVLRRLRAESD
ncbi:MAG: thioredoxin family protein [Burkholderiales bacterium]